MRCQYVYKSTRVYTYLVGNVRYYYERNSSIKICKCLEKDSGLKEYWDWIRRRKRGLDIKDWMNGLSEYGDWVLTGR